MAEYMKTSFASSFFAVDTMSMSASSIKRMIFIVLSLMQNMDYFTRKHTSVIDIYVELENREYMGEFIEFMRDAGLTMSNLQMEPDYLGTNSINSVAFVVTVRSLEHRPHDSMIDTLRHIPHLKFIEEL